MENPTPRLLGLLRSIAICQTRTLGEQPCTRGIFGKGPHCALAVLQAKSTLAATDQGTTLPLQDKLEAALGPALAKPAKILGKPKSDEILGNKSVKGWSRFPDLGELLLSNIGPPQYDGKLRALKPPN